MKNSHATLLTSDDTKQLASLQALRGVAAVAVLIFHLRAVEAKYLPGDSLLNEVARHADAGVDLFFVISGFVMARVSRGHFLGFASAASFLMKRAWRVLPMYWLFTTLVVLLMWIAPALVNSSFPDQSIVRSYFLIPHSQVPVLAVGWSLVHEAYFYLAFATLIALIAERALTPSLVGWAALIAIAHTGGPVDSSPARELLTSPLTFEFIAGALSGLHWRRVPVYLGGVLRSVGIFILVSSSLLLTSPSASDAHAWLRVATFGSASVMLVLGWTMLECRREVRIPGFLVALGNSSYALYLSHVFVISAIGRVWAVTVPVATWGYHVLFLGVAIGSACVLGLLVHRWIELPLLSLPRRMGELLKLSHAGRGSTRGPVRRA